MTDADPREPEPGLARIGQLIGPDGLSRLDNAFVVVVGLGAVGSYAVEALARSGVGRLRVVDFDRIQPSNLNRQLYALHSTLGQTKAQAAGQRIRDIRPRCHVESLSCFVHVETMEEVLADSPSLVIDAIDSLTPKVALLEACHQRGLTVLSAMGAALRSDPGRIRISRLSRTRICPLAKQVRKALRSCSPQTDPVCVWSDEPIAHLPERALAPPEPRQQSLQRGRPRRLLGSLPTLPGIFGLTLANAALEAILGDLWIGPPRLP
jgi:tRNA A37 threonylcarbamoyladenosine dehydratase